MSRRPAVWFLVVSVAFGVGMWFLTRGDGSIGPRSTEDPDPGTSGGPTAAGALQGESHVEIVIEPIAELIDSRPETGEPCRLVEGGAPVPARVDIVAGSGPDRDGSYRGRHLLRFTLAGGSAIWRVVDLPTRELACFAPTTIEGGVVDAGGRPIEGAAVWSGATAADGQPILVHTDAEGRFLAVGVPSTLGVPIVVRAAGHASHWRVVDLIEPANRPLSLQLVPAVVVGVAVRSRIDRPELGSASAFPTGEDGDLELRHYPFFWPVVDPSYGRLDATGRARFDDLPRGIRVAFDIRHPTFASGGRSAAVRLRKAEHRVVVSVPAAGRVTGRALAPDGESMIDAVVELLHPAPESVARGWLVPRRSVPSTSIAADGRFDLSVPAGAEVRVGVRASGRWGLALVCRDGDDLGELPLVRRSAERVPGPPSVRIVLPDDGARRRARLRGPGELQWIDDRTVGVTVSDPLLVDLNVRLEDASGVRSRDWRALPVPAPTEVSMD